MKISLNQIINTFYFAFAVTGSKQNQDGFYHCACDLVLLIHHQWL